MAIASYLREIGRGAKGARSLGVDAARDLMAQLLDGRLSDLEVGAFAIAMRMKGDSLDELSGFLLALHERLNPLTSDRAVVSIASYNGARRLPNLVPLLALLLSRAGVRVLVHGPLNDPNRVTTAQVFEALGLPPATSAGAAAADWRHRNCSFVPTGLLSSSLERLLEVRRTVGLRNSGHTIAKMMSPVTGAPCLCLMSYTHPEFGQLMADHAQRAARHVGLLRGTEGEAVADPRRRLRQRIWLHGRPQADLSVDEAAALGSVPDLPAASDAATTARWIEAALDEEVSVPPAITEQVGRLAQALHRLDDTAARPSGAEGSESG